MTASSCVISFHINGISNSYKKEKKESHDLPANPMEIKLSKKIEFDEMKNLTSSEYPNDGIGVSMNLNPSEYKVELSNLPFDLNQFIGKISSPNFSNNSLTFNGCLPPDAKNKLDVMNTMANAFTKLFK
ncbi:22431_t:CDS:2 [Dentiscutata erythropus]|uniref:22431_t:CDS:1 n=1 Tax=Dentiscutata erythropus TaxID=1348616 RepID=A0A9N9F3H8_9GLOM|nr:22431_t:CDS:2 [Dentiscutata erythropus]